VAIELGHLPSYKEVEEMHFTSCLSGGVFSGECVQYVMREYSNILGNENFTGAKGDVTGCINTRCRLRAEQDAEREYRAARREIADFYKILPEKSRFWRLVFEGPNFILKEWMNKTCNGVEIVRQTFLNYVFYGTDKLDWFQDDDYKQLYLAIDRAWEVAKYLGHWLLEAVILFRAVCMILRWNHVRRRVGFLSSEIDRIVMTAGTNAAIDTRNLEHALAKLRAEMTLAPVCVWLVVAALCWWWLTMCALVFSATLAGFIYEYMIGRPFYEARLVANVAGEAPAPARFRVKPPRQRPLPVLADDGARLPGPDGLDRSVLGGGVVVMAEHAGPQPEDKAHAAITSMLQYHNAYLHTYPSKPDLPSLMH